MKKLWRRASRVFSDLLSEKRVVFLCGATTRSITLSPATQVTGIITLAALACLAVAALAVITINLGRGTLPETEYAISEAAYEARIDELKSERDAIVVQLTAAQAQVSSARDQLAAKQDHVQDLTREQQELTTSLALSQERAARLSGELVTLRAEAETASQRLSELETEVAARLERGSEMERTLELVSRTLENASAERDNAIIVRREMARDLADLELELLVSEKAHDEMFQQVEQAIALSLDPLETMFKSSNVELEMVLSDVKELYSGAGGGPVATLSSRSFDGTSNLSDRFDRVMSDLDKINLLRVAANKIPYAIPVKDTFRFTSGFGYRRDPKGRGRRMHAGIDLAAPKDTPIYATADGVVKSAKRERGYGNTVRIVHGFGFETVYAHQSRLRVKTGDRVSRGDHIGDMGTTGRSTGVHLHYEVRLNGRPINPMTYLEAAKNVH